MIATFLMIFGTFMKDNYEEMNLLRLMKRVKLDDVVVVIEEARK